MNYAVLLAAGKAKRMGYEVPKQFLLLGEKKIYQYPLDVLLNNEYIDKIILVVGLNQDDFIDEKYLNNEKICKIYGGFSRQKSVENALDKIKELGAKKEDKVLIFDAARPFLKDDYINKIYQVLDEHSAATLAIKSVDSLAIASGENITQFIDREKIYQIQTPQGFLFGIILKAHEAALKDKISEATDDARLAIKIGIDVKLILGDASNIKITRNEDLEEALFLVRKKR
jgi:2-C-methyl-D-erythritol 4-phosphate cytidylyltransferase